MKEVLLATRFDNDENAKIQMQLWEDMFKRKEISSLSFCESITEITALYSIKVSEPEEAENHEPSHTSPASRVGWIGID